MIRLGSDKKALDKNSFNLVWVGEQISAKPAVWRKLIQVTAKYSVSWYQVSFLVGRLVSRVWFGTAPRLGGHNGGN